MIFAWLIFLLIAGGLVPEYAAALPQFPIRFGLQIYDDDHAHMHEGGSKTMDCRACHINPTGGGMRNQHGRQFAVSKLPVHEPTEEYLHLLEEAQITPFLALGTDFRLAYLRAQSETTSAYKDTLFPMQGDLYVSFTPTDHLSFYYQDGFQGNREVFGIIHGLPRNAHVKLGKFIPPYGLKLDDHTSFIREKLRLGNTFGTESESGIEAGFADDVWFGNAAVFNGSGPAPDDNRSKAFSGTAGIKNPSWWLAGSYYNNKTGSGAASVTRQYVGAYTALRYRLVAFLGEWDWITIDDAADQNGDVSYAELNATLTRGIVAKVKYDRYDPDRDVSGDRLERITFGFDLYPYPFTEVFLQYRWNIEENDARNDQILIMTHFFF